MCGIGDTRNECNIFVGIFVRTCCLALPRRQLEDDILLDVKAADCENVCFLVYFTVLSIAVCIVYVG